MANNINLTVPIVERTLSSESNEDDFLDFSRELTKALANQYTLTESDLLERGNGVSTAATPKSAGQTPITKIVERLAIHADELDKRLTEEQPNEQPPASPHYFLSTLLTDVWGVDYELFESTCTNTMRKFQDCFTSCRDQVVFIYSSVRRMLEQLGQESSPDTFSRQQLIEGFAGRYIYRNLRDGVSSPRALEEIFNDSNDPPPFIDVD